MWVLRDTMTEDDGAYIDINRALRDIEDAYTAEEE